MEVKHRVAWSIFILVCIHVNSTYGKCPKNLPLEIGGECYRLQTDLFPYTKAVENCETLADQSKIVSFMTTTPEKLANEIKGFISKQIEKTYYWIGFKTDDTDINKHVKERKWSFDFDDSTVIQKDYELWAEQPTDAALTCAVVNGSRDFNVVAVDCGGPRLPVVCMKKSDPCQDDQKPFMVYGDYCLLALSGTLEYNKIAGACHPDTPTPVKDKEMKKYVVNAVMNAILGGAVFVGVRKIESVYLFGSRPVPNEMWGEGEPRQNYACAGLALEMDGSVKLRTISCDKYAASLCHVRGT
ncbi:hypothetical protein AVEN_165078-1 [Araneus ventricosus]|uniref:C-type lectin domain-containing protein n=1 Tax=Araneus ventricosus TaxID=182803 RepID=A0A4Y2F8M3_ARAVE|nr:hypothetical protein AVEN_165078-1 [Araneus ventricosus]